MNEPNTIKKGMDVELEIESLAFGGMGVAHLNEMVAFVKNAIPGQKVTARITKRLITQSQERLCPKRPMIGSFTLSISGAHRNLKLYAKKVNAKAVTALFEIPSCANRVVRVAPIRANGKAEDIPRKNAARGSAST